jgi:peptidoglycan/xylan/chitin deacetylase (PgdA/CDA1 family)
MTSSGTEAAPLATIVMYHRILPPQTGRRARLNALDLSAFREQIAYIRRHYTPVSAADLVSAAEGVSPLPPRPIVLTFDDGYREHYQHVLPVLDRFAIPGVFFPVSSSMLDRQLLDVNKIQYILAMSDEVAPLVDAIDAAIEYERRDSGSPSRADYRARWWKPSRWDPAPVVYVKRLLQHALPESVRRPLTDTLFRDIVSADEAAFADELYMTVSDAREMRAAGMTVGAHGGRHLRLPTLSRDGQAHEIDGALRVIDAVGASRQKFAYSYANGEHDEHSVDLLRARGCGVAFTTHPDLARLTGADALSLPRIDANDLPTQADAPPNSWTTRAAEHAED